MDSVFQPFLLSLLAGMATGIGGIIVLLLRRVSDRIVSFSMGFASGVMLMVAFNNLFLEAEKFLAHVELIILFSLGAVMMIVLDLTIPHIELTTRKGNGKDEKMLRSGVLIAIGITLHNLPEGFVVAAGYSYMPSLGLIIAIAIMLHNIPEGVATAIPFTEAGTRPLKIAVITLLSGLAEPVGALVGAFALSFVGTRTVVGYSLVFAAGVMTYITADELIPVAHEYGFKHTVSVGLLLGIIFALLVDVLLSAS
jgi:ZIP family zinc transporter